MKKNKVITTAIIASLVLNGLPINVLTNEVYARDYADVWNFENVNTNNDFNAFGTYLPSIVPMEFTIPKYIDGTRLTTILATRNIQNKGIQYVSFIETESISEIGSKDEEVFQNNEIRKIYWNKSDFYINDITIYPNVFKNNKIQSLHLPTKVVTISNNAFQNNEITWIKGMDNVTTLATYAFDTNKLISSLPNGYKFEIPKKLTILQSYTFSNNLLTSVTIPKNILDVRANSFLNNPITELYFENQNTKIATDMLGTYKKSNMIIYGHGETSTAKTFASYNGATYINVNELEWYIIDAEEAKTQEKLDVAYTRVNQMTEGQLKTTYLERLDQVRLSFGIEGYVAKAEMNTTFENYYIAKEKVLELKDGFTKKTFESRLESVLNKLNFELKEQLIKEIEQLKTKDDANVSDLEQIKDKIADMSDGTDKTNLINQINSLKELANKNTYLLAENATEHAENYPNIKNIIEARNMIGLLPNGFYLIEDTTRSKENLMNRIDSISPKIYVEEAIKKAEKTTRQEDIDNARLLTFYIEDQLERNNYLNKIEALQNKLNGYDELFKSIDKSINDYTKFGTADLYDKAIEQIKSIANESLEQEFLDKLYEASYINKIDKLIMDAEVYGLTEQTRIELLSNMALINPEHSKYDALIVKIKPLLEGFDTYKVDYLQIMKSIQAINVNDVHSLNLENYAKIRSEVLTLKRNNIYKEELLSELNKLQLKLTTLENGLKGSDIIKNDINNIENIENNISDIKNIISTINQFDNEAVRKMLKEELDLQLEKLALETIEQNIINSTKITEQTIKTLKEYIANVSNKELKQAIINEVSNTIQDKMIEEVNTKGIEKLIKNKFTLFGQEMELLKELVTKEDNANITNVIDNKINEYIQNTYNSSTVMNEKVLTELADLYNLIENNQIKETNEQKIENILKTYFDVNYVGYKNDTLNKGEYQEILTILNKFKNFNFQAIDYDAMVEKNDAILKKKIDDSINSITFNNQKEIKELISNIENVKETFLKEELDKKLVSALMEQLNAIDLNNKSSLKEIIDIMNTLNGISSVNANTKTQFNNVLEEYFNNNPVTIAGLAKDTAYEEQMNYTLYKYLTEENAAITNIYTTDVPRDLAEVQYNDERILKELTEIEDKLDRIKEVNTNLLVLLEKLNTEKGSISNSYIPPQINEYNPSYTTNSSDYEKIYNNMYNELKEKESNTLIQDNFEDNKELVSVLSKKIDTIKETNEETIIDNRINKQIEDLLKDSKKLNNKFEQFEEESKNTTNGLMALSLSLWLLILTGMGIIRRKFKKLSAENQEMKNKMEELYELNSKILEEIKKQKP